MQSRDSYNLHVVNLELEGKLHHHRYTRSEVLSSSIIVLTIYTACETKGFAKDREATTPDWCCELSRLSLPLLLTCGCNTSFVSKTISLATDLTGRNSEYHKLQSVTQNLDFVVLDEVRQVWKVLNHEKKRVWQSIVRILKFYH